MSKLNHSGNGNVAAEPIISARHSVISAFEEQAGVRFSAEQTSCLSEVEVNSQAARPPRDPGAKAREFGAKEIEEFLHLLLDGTHRRCFAHVMDLHSGGVAMESICLDLLTPVAQELGSMWLSDELSFSEVSIGLAHLQSLVSKFARSQTPQVALPDPNRHIALARPSGEQHTFGLSMVGEFFRLSGWQIAGGVALETGRGLNDLLASNWVTVLGLTAGSRRTALDLKDPIAMARSQSANPDIVVLLGGAAFVSEPDLLSEIGGDCLAVDSQAALKLAEQSIAAPATVS